MIVIVVSTLISLAQVASPTVADAMKNEQVRSAILSAVGKNNDVGLVPDAVQYVQFYNSELSKNNVDVDMLTCFPRIRALFLLKQHVKMKGFEKLDALIELTLVGGVISDLDTKKQYPSIRYLTIIGLNWINDDTAVLAQLPNLEYLNLRNNHITSLGKLDSLERLRLLDIRGNEIPESEISRFGSLHSDTLLLTGSSNTFNDYTAARLLTVQSSCARYCLPGIIEYWQNTPNSLFKRRLPWHEQLTRALELLDRDKETCHYSNWIAVIVRHAQYFRDDGDKDGSFSEKDPGFEWFLTHTSFARNETGNYLYRDVVEWIEKNKETFAPCILLDDMLAAYKESNKK